MTFQIGDKVRVKDIGKIGTVVYLENNLILVLFPPYFTEWVSNNDVEKIIEDKVCFSVGDNVKFSNGFLSRTGLALESWRGIVTAIGKSFIHVKWRGQQDEYLATNEDIVQYDKTTEFDHRMQKHILVELLNTAERYDLDLTVYGPNLPNEGFFSGRIVMKVDTPDGKRWIIHRGELGNNYQIGVYNNKYCTQITGLKLHAWTTDEIRTRRTN